LADVVVVCRICRFVQTVLYMDFFYYYIQSKWYGKKFVLPA
jgi:hypothetical protein